MSVSQKNNETESNECQTAREMIRERFLEPLQHEVEAQLQEHLDRCASCRDYVRQLGAIVTDLTELPPSSIGPSPAFQRVWRKAVIESSVSQAKHGPGIIHIVQEVLRRNWRPALSLSGVWMLTFVFFISTPKPASVETGKTGWTPADVVQFFDSERQLMLVGNIQPDRT
jgi:hypothetical protein